MKDEQVEKIVAALSGNGQQQKQLDLSDVLMKIGVGVSTTCIIGIITFIIGMGMDVRLIQQSQQTDKEQRIEFQKEITERMDNFEEFMRKPQFTENNFAEKTTPIKNDIQNNTARIVQQEKSIEGLRDDLANMSKDITIIRMAVDPNYKGIR